jgi:hypothetical protein
MTFSVLRLGMRMFFPEDVRGPSINQDGPRRHESVEKLKFGRIEYACDFHPQKIGGT